MDGGVQGNEREKMVGVWKGEGKGRHEGRGRKRKITTKGAER